MDATLMVARDAMLEGRFDVAAKLFAEALDGGVRLPRSEYSLIKLAMAAASKPNQRVVYITTSHRNAEGAFIRLAEILGGLGLEHSRAYLRIRLHNGSEIRAVSSSEPERLRGHRFNAVEMNPDVDLPWPVEVLTP